MNFKPGDWVLDDEDCLFQVSSIRSDEIALVDEPYYLKAVDFKHWKPRPDVWVWYGYELVQVIDDSNPIKICRQNSDSYEEVSLSKIEPFIGNLPSRIMNER